MAEPFLAEIRLFSFSFPPRGWALCNGQLLPIAQNQALFSLLGTTYGGDGRVNFALPDLRGRAPIHHGNGHHVGEQGGERAHALTDPELPAHTHPAQASPSPGNDSSPAGTVLASPPDQTYRPAGLMAAMQPSSVGTIGAGEAHPNMQPFLALTFCIAIEGIFPSRN